MRKALKKIERALKKTKRFLILVLFHIMLAAGRLVPKSAGAAAGRALGRLCFHILVRERNKAMLHMSVAFPDKSPEWIRATIRQTFINFGIGLIETIKLPYLTQKDFSGFEIEGKEHLDNALARGKGAIMLTGHIGNWEALVCCLIKRGYRGGVIAKRIKTYGYNSLVTSFRASYGVQTIFQQGALRQCLKILKSGGVIGILPDQDIPKQPGVFVPFFGKDSYAPTGPAIIAKASRAPILPHFISRINGQFLKHKITILPPLDFQEMEDKDTEILENTRQWTEIIENWIREHPTEWVWFHRRWRTAPPKNEQ